MVTSRTRGRRPVSKASSRSSASARTIWRIRSARKLTQNTPSVPNPWGARDDPRLHELVGLARLVGLTHGAHRVGRGLADAVHHRVVGDPGPLSALVAVHRVVAAHAGGVHGPAPVLPDAVAQAL